MLYHHIFKKFQKQARVTAALIGAGNYGSAIVAQQRYTPYLRVPVVADRNADNARLALKRAGVADADIQFCETAAQATQAVERGRFVVTDQPEIVPDISGVDIVCESTGNAEAAARNAVAAIRNQKSVAMITKDCDAAVGPMLRRMAEDAGVVYTPVDGDQHGLLMGMVEWAHIIGLEILCAGKATDGELVLDERAATVRLQTDKHIPPPYTDTARLLPEQLAWFGPIPRGKGAEYLSARADALRMLPTYGSYDLCEMLIAANATGLTPSGETLTRGALRITELPEVYCPEQNGGIYQKPGVIDLVTCLRRADEAGLGGGVFLVVRCDNAYANHILTTKGQIANADGSAAVLYRPYHLCGVESSTSLLSAVLLGLDTGCGGFSQRYDLARVAARNITAGEVIGGDHDASFRARIVLAGPIAPDSPAAAHLATGNRAAADIPAGTTITYGMIEWPGDSVLWDLRRQQDQITEARGEWAHV